MNNVFKHLQAIIFDVDGTLADTEEVHRLAFNRVFSEYGLDWNWTPELYRELLAISGGRERIGVFGADLASRFESAADFDDFVLCLHQGKTRRYAAMLTEGEVALRPGIRRLLLTARDAGLVLGIATSSARGNVETLLDNNLPPGWRAWFAAIETCESVPQKKPSPAVYQAVLARIGVDPSNVVALEDTQNGARAASAAGLLTIVTTHRYTQEHTFPSATLVVDSAGEPDRPFKLNQGDSAGHRYLDLALFEHLLATRAEPALAELPARIRAAG